MNKQRRRMKLSPVRRQPLDKPLIRLLKEWITAGTAKDAHLKLQDFEAAAACIKVRNDTADQIIRKLIEIYGI